MRLTVVVPVVVAALAGCSPKPSSGPPPSKGSDLTIEVALVQDHGKCVVRVTDANLKDARNAIVATTDTVIWKVTANDCGEKKKVHHKALGLKSMKQKGSKDDAFWLKGCSDLSCVPAGGGVEFKCPIPTSLDPRWNWTGDDQTYEYEMDGDEVDPGDPGLGIRRNG